MIERNLPDGSGIHTMLNRLYAKCRHCQQRHTSTATTSQRQHTKTTTIKEEKTKKQLAPTTMTFEWDTQSCHFVCDSGGGILVCC